MKKLIRVREVEPLHDFVVRFTFTNGEERDIDLDQYIDGPIFQPLRDAPDLFRAAYVAGGTIAWPNGADIDPDAFEGPERLVRGFARVTVTGLDGVRLAGRLEAPSLPLLFERAGLGMLAGSATIIFAGLIVYREHR